MINLSLKKYSFVLCSFLWLVLPNAASLGSATSSIKVVIDPRLELLAVVQHLSGYGDRYGLITSFDFPYKKEVAAYFSQYKDQAAVKLFAEMSKAGFSYDAPPNAMLYLSNPPELALHMPFSDYLKERAGGGERLEKFVQALRDFARQSKFIEFFKIHESLY
jgi:hypothetical protein